MLFSLKVGAIRLERITRPALEDKQDNDDEEKEEDEDKNENENEAEGVMAAVPKAESRKRKKPASQNQPACSGSCCWKLTQAMRNAKWKKQCGHCLTLFVVTTIVFEIHCQE
jgi:hypothetical protein